MADSWEDQATEAQPSAPKPSLNPSAATFSFNPGAGGFTPSFTPSIPVAAESAPVSKAAPPKPSDLATNGVQETSAVGNADSSQPGGRSSRNSYSY